MDLLSIALGFILGALAVWLAAGARQRARMEELRKQMEEQSSSRSRAEERSLLLDEQLRKLAEDLAAERGKVLELSSALSKSHADSSNLDEKLRTQKAEIEELHRNITEQFQNIANRILLDNSQVLKQQHKQELSDILDPLKEKIDRFERRVDDTHKETIKENQSLKEQIAGLQKLNQSIGEEAKNLTTALKGQSKVQGSWGEIILERILEKSGLVKDREYVVQSSMAGEDGRRLQPDVIVNLPDNKQLIIDAKVSLNAYDRFCSAGEGEDRDVALREHLLSIRKHIKELGQKNYQALYQIKSPDFVFMFVPIEPAFNLAIQTDNELYNDAFERNIVIISASTLWASLRIIANLWRQENQNRHALEIARQGGELYDKFVGFVEDLVELGRKMQGAEKSYQDAMNKLHKGRGNLVRRAEEMRSLGARSAKTLPAGLLERTEDDGKLPDDEEQPPAS